VQQLSQAPQPPQVAERSAAMTSALWENLGGSGAIELLWQQDESITITAYPRSPEHRVAERRSLLSHIGPGSTVQFGVPDVIAASSDSIAGARAVLLLWKPANNLIPDAAAALLKDHAQRWLEWMQISNIRFAQLGQQMLIGATARAAERRRLAYMLHGGLAQDLAAATMHADTAEMLGGEPESAEIITIAAAHMRAAHGQIRDLLTEMHRDDSDLPLEEAVRQICRDYEHKLFQRDQATLQVSVSLPDDILPLAVRETVLLVLRESLQNVYEHACASHVEVDVAYDNAQLLVEISDDGVGFEEPVNDDGQVHLGVSGMYEHVKRIGGACSIVGVPAGGTTTTVSLPAPMWTPPSS
jgi:signal transduction histidine kinase